MGSVKLWSIDRSNKTCRGQRHHKICLVTTNTLLTSSWDKSSMFFYEKVAFAKCCQNMPVSVTTSGFLRWRLLSASSPGRQSWADNCFEEAATSPQVYVRISQTTASPRSTHARTHDTSRNDFPIGLSPNLRFVGICLALSV